MAQYKSLTSGDISSENYEIRHLVYDRMLGFDNDDDKVLIDTLTRNFIVKSEKRYEEADSTIFYYLWKINLQGSIIDSFTVYQDAFLFKSHGYLLQFNDDNYNDWMRTGNKSFHAVSEVINADTLMGEDDLLQKFDLMKSEGQLLGHLTNDTIVKYYFVKNNHITVLYGVKRLAYFDEDCTIDKFALGKEITIAQFVTMDANEEQNEYLNQDPDIGPNVGANTPFYLYKKHFLYLKKRRWFVSYTSSAPTGYHGAAFMNLYYKKEILKFKTYAYKEHGQCTSNITSFYFGSGELPSFFIVDNTHLGLYYGHYKMFAPNGVFEQEGIHYAKETGLYVVAEK